MAAAVLPAVLAAPNGKVFQRGGWGGFGGWGSSDSDSSNNNGNGFGGFGGAQPSMGGSKKLSAAAYYAEIFC